MSAPCVHIDPPFNDPPPSAQHHHSTAPPPPLTAKHHHSTASSTSSASSSSSPSSSTISTTPASAAATAPIASPSSSCSSASSAASLVAVDGGRRHSYELSGEVPYVAPGLAPRVYVYASAQEVPPHHQPISCMMPVYRSLSLIDLHSKPNVWHWLFVWWWCYQVTFQPIVPHL